MKNLAIVLLLGLCVVGFAQDAAEPPDHGAYYKSKDGWQKLELLTTSGSNVHVNALTLHGGNKQLYRGAEAPVQLSDRRPVFYIKTTPDKEQQLAIASRDTVIVLLTKKEDHRELQTVKTGAVLCEPPEPIAMRGYEASPSIRSFRSAYSSDNAQRYVCGNCWSSSL
jgi:hypothetical protein